jgi:hypothetical protein
MAGTRRTATAKPRKAPKKTRARATYQKLLKLAPKLKPPQSWYEDDSNPFEAKRAG